MLVPRPRSDSVKTVAILLALLIAASAAAAPPRRPTSPDDALCRIQFRRAVAGRPAADIAAPCWRIGPIALGMREAAVEQRIGRPVAATDRSTTRPGPHRVFHATLHAFSAMPGAPVQHGRARLGLTELLYDDGTLVAIDTAPGARIDGFACPGGATSSATAKEVEIDARTGPLLRFATVEAGDPLATLGRVFGKPPSGNRSRDWFTYLPVPISVDVDPDRAAIVGFTIATDAQTLTTSFLPMLHRQHDATCRLTAIQFALS
jgi:hypothetical protein